MDKEFELLANAVEEISGIAKGFGLDYYEMRFEICPADILYTFGAYGMPTRFTHWSFGKAFHRMKTSYDYNLSRIYELVINTNPCYAFLLEGNSLIQNKLVIAHVFAHCDFFKNNCCFRKTNRDMVNSMAAAADRVSEFEDKYGRSRVEGFLDAVLALQEHIDPANPLRNVQEEETKKIKTPKSAYEDLWFLEKLEKETEQNQEAELRSGAKKIPAKPEKDLLYFLMQHSKNLADWEREIISLVREEMLYFWPQIQTKIMNEGWASLWHSRILRELDLTVDESIEFAKMHAGVVQPSRTVLNPYYLGLKIWEDIEKRWNNPSPEEQKKYGRTGGEGLKKIFEVRETESDISFLRNYLTKELIEELDLYLYKKVGHQWQIVEKDWENVRTALVNNLVNGGFPTIMVINGDYHDNGELYLQHMYEGIELDIRYLEKTLPHVYKLWGRPTHLETVIDGKPVLFSHDGIRSSKKIL